MTNRLNEQWQHTFRQRAADLHQQGQYPEQRCTDAAGWLLMLIIAAACIATSVSQNGKHSEETINDMQVTQIRACNFWVVMLSCFLNVLIVWALRGCVQCTVGVLIVGGFSLQIVLALVLLIHYQWLWLSILALWLVVSLAIFNCHQKQPEASMLLYRVTSYFLTEVSACIWVGILSTAFLAALSHGWLVNSILLAYFNSSSASLGTIILQAYILLVLAMCVYYGAVLMIAELAVEFHRGNDESTMSSSCCSLIRHFGSVVLAAFLCLPLKLIQVLVKSTKPDECFVNPCSSAILCVMQPCQDTLEYYSLVIGRSAFTVMTVFREGLLQSSRHAGVLLYHHLQASSKVEVASRVLVNAQISIVICANILLGLYLLPDRVDGAIIAVGIAAGLLVSLPIVALLEEPMHSLFLLDTFDLLMKGLDISSQSRLPGGPLNSPASTLFQQSFERLRQSESGQHNNLQPLVDAHAQQMEAIQYWSRRNEALEYAATHPQLVRPTPAYVAAGYREVTPPLVPSPYPKLGPLTQLPSYHSHLPMHNNSQHN